jgi:hypothetical protein
MVSLPGHSLIPNAMIFPPAAMATNCFPSNRYVVGDARQFWLAVAAVASGAPHLERLTASVDRLRERRPGRRQHGSRLQEDKDDARSRHWRS